MHSTQSTRIHRLIDRTISFFRRIGIWHGEVTPTMGQLILKLFYSIYHMFFFTSLYVGAITSDTTDESIFLAETAIVTTVLTIKIWMLIWKQRKIMRLFNRICIFSIRNEEEFEFFNEKVENFIKFVIIFACAAVFASFGNAIFPFIGKEKTLIVDIAFPLDYKNSEIGFWMAYIFFVSENVLTLLAMTLSIVIWYLLLHCSLRYKILGMEIRNMGRVTDNSKVKISVKEQQAIFYRDLVASIEAHLHLRGLIDELESFLSKLFLLEFATRGLCICGSIYCLAFDISDNFVERIVHVYTFFYNTAELFMITYFGNEIMLSSGRLTYCLFESEWIGQPRSTTKCIIIFGEYLRQSDVMLIGKLYPLTLETFTRILKSSYSLFNILKNTKQ
ncbi:putative odorant receptor 71a [Bradysia coprophila]|uniref:putative odorant receptor 71a n=1 Tax=Bradysia coprophila TaxID=38358 RepID=UPI00187D9697|nr:putative odorant receptor 71a [Bradysia coprophila]